MSLTEQTSRRIKEPIAGPWAWRELLPVCQCELDDLRVRSAVANPQGIHLGRFLRWAEAEATGQDLDGVPTGPKALAKYRRFLWELNVDHEPAHAGDVVLADLECAFEREATTVGAGEGNLTERAMGGEWRVAA